MRREWLIAYRKAKGLSQIDVADATGVTQMMISNIENGKRRPSPKLARSLARIFNFEWTRFYEEDLK